MEIFHLVGNEIPYVRYRLAPFVFLFILSATLCPPRSDRQRVGRPFHFSFHVWSFTCYVKNSGVRVGKGVAKGEEGVVPCEKKRRERSGKRKRGETKKGRKEGRKGGRKKERLQRWGGEN